MKEGMLVRFRLYTTKKALESMDGETKLIVLVDNEPAVQNVTRFAEGKTAKLKARRSQTMNLRLRSWQRIIHRQDEEEEIVCANPSARMILSLLYHPTRWDKERKLLVRH